MDKLICNYCGKEKSEVSFYIGASREPAWVMVEGTGKITCPDCWEKATRDGQTAINKYINNCNEKARAKNDKKMS